MRFLLVGHTIFTSTCSNDNGVDHCKHYSNKKMSFGSFRTLLAILGYLSPTGTSGLGPFGPNESRWALNGPSGTRMVLEGPKRTDSSLV